MGITAWQRKKIELKQKCIWLSLIHSEYLQNWLMFGNMIFPPQKCQNINTCKNLASRPIATLKLIWRSRKLHLALRPNKQYFSTGILLGEEKKRRFPYRESNPGRLGENQES